MVKNDHTKRQRSIKSKLMAAVCMLLVSCIMMVSSTYAWFTLSTAPEVTGISTAVGANGNLEMALMPEDGLTTTAENFGITSGSGDSLLDQGDKNITWGNLVDLADIYGMEEITLYPAALNVATSDDHGNPTSIADLMLKTPTYGSDGRVSELIANTVTSTYVASDQNFPQNSLYGVRAVGTASGMTDRQLAYRNTVSAANTAKAQAKTIASQSLNVNGASLADIALKHAAASGGETYNSTEIGYLKAIVKDLLGYDDGSNHVTGVLEYIESAYLNYIVAFGASKAASKTETNPNGMDDNAFKAFQSAVTGAENVYKAIELVGSHGVTLPADLTAAVSLLKTTKENVVAANSLLNSLTGDDIPWGDGQTTGISAALYKLADPDAMLINGYAAGTVKENMSNIINSVTSQGLTVTIASGGGVYADIADHCGDYNAAIVIKEVEYNGLKLENMNARMTTATDVTKSTESGGKGKSDVYLGLIGAAVTLAGAPDSVGGQIMPISDMYGYIIDLAFRTNAADSNLLLQVDATDRIYKTNTADSESMGHGSNMTFTSVTTDFTVSQMVELMKAIRIVFFDPSSKAVYATGKLDLTPNAYDTVGGNTVTANIYLYTVVSGGSTTYTETADTEAQTGVTYYERLDADRYVEKTGLTAGDSVVGYYTTSDNGATYTKVESGSYVAGTTYYEKVAAGSYLAVDFAAAKAAGKTVYVQTTVTATTEIPSTDNVITALTQNTAAAVSVLVYLDGANVGNEDVAATAAESMKGTMNLQFASSANLVPMQYTPLVSQTGNQSGEAPQG